MQTHNHSPTWTLDGPNLKCNLQTFTLHRAELRALNVRTFKDIYSALVMVIVCHIRLLVQFTQLPVLVVYRVALLCVRIGDQS